MRPSICYLLVLSIFYSCTPEKKEEKEKIVVGYEMKTFRVESERCKTDSAKCATYEVVYPEFSGLDSIVSKKIKAKIDSVVTAGYSEGLPQTFEQTAGIFMDQYENFIAEDEESASVGWYYSSDVKVEVLTDSLISLSLHSEDYLGGAHPNASTSFINVDPKTGNTVGLSLVLKPGYEVPLTTVGEKVFRTVRELPDTATFSFNYFEFPEDKFQLNKNFGFRPEGIVFFFNSYEIAPYAAGPTEVLIPYTEIKDLLK